MNESGQNAENNGSPAVEPTKATHPITTPKEQQSSAGGDLRCAPERPLSVTVFGAFNILFGCLGLNVSSEVINHLLKAGQTQGLASGYWTFLLIMNGIGFGFSIWLLGLGIGLLKLRKWARNGSVLYGWLGILFFVIETGVNFLALAFGWVKIPQEKMTEFIVGMGIGAVGGLVYPILLLIFMKRAKVKEAFRAIGEMTE